MYLVLLFGCLILGLAVILFGQKTLMERLEKETGVTEETITEKIRSALQGKRKVQELEESLKNMETKMQDDKNTLDRTKAESQKMDEETKTCETLQVRDCCIVATVYCFLHTQKNSLTFFFF